MRDFRTLPGQGSKTPQPVTRYWMLLLAFTLFRAIVFMLCETCSDGVASRLKIEMEAWKKELWDLEYL
jgi:hypothetical protein